VEAGRAVMASSPLCHSGTDAGLPSVNVLICISVCLFVCVTVDQSPYSVSLSVCSLSLPLLIYLSVSLACVFVFPHVFLSVNMSVYFTVCISKFLKTIVGCSPPHPSPPPPQF
jgi:hypothetical protein